MCYFKEEVNDELYFWHADKHQSLLKVDTIIWLCITRHAQSTQSNNLISLQYLKENVKDGVGFFMVIQIHVVFDVCGQTCPNYPKQKLCYFSAIS